MYKPSRLKLPEENSIRSVRRCWVDVESEECIVDQQKLGFCSLAQKSTRADLATFYCLQIKPGEYQR